MRRLFDLIGGRRRTDEQLRSAVINLRNLIETDSLVRGHFDGRYQNHQQQFSYSSTDALSSHLRSTPSSENLAIAERECLGHAFCTRCGTIVRIDTSAAAADEDVLCLVCDGDRAGTARANVADIDDACDFFGSSDTDEILHVNDNDPLASASNANFHVNVTMDEHPVVVTKLEPITTNDGFVLNMQIRIDRSTPSNMDATCGSRNMSLMTRPSKRMKNVWFC